MLTKISKVLHESGPLGLTARATAFAYRRVRPLLPSVAPVRYSGVQIGIDHKLGDGLLPSVAKSFRDIPDYEAALVSALKDNVRVGDRVIVIGGGWGVTATIAAQRVVPHGHVTCFEGSLEGVRRVIATAKRNGVHEHLTVRHAIVGEAFRVYETSQTGETLSADDLPECDFLEMDCEGSELSILRSMSIRPRIIAVETHGMYGASSASVALLLKEIGYSVSDMGLAEPRASLYCETNDVRVLVAEKRSWVNN